MRRKGKGCVREQKQGSTSIIMIEAHQWLP